MGIKIFDNTFNMIEKALDVRLKRHQVISGNVANSDTPNFTAREYDFSGTLERMMSQGDRNELARTHQTHMDVNTNRTPHVAYDNSGAVGSDGNNVDLDIQMGKLSANSRAYTAATNYLNMKLRLIRFAANGGRGGV